MIQLVFNPCAALQEVVEHFWYSKVDLSGAVQQLYPTPVLQGLTFNFRRLAEHHAIEGRILTLSGQAYLFGQPTCARDVTTHEAGIEVLGVKFKPLGITRVTGINMEHIADNIIAAEDIWGRELELLCDEMQSAARLEGAIQVLETFLLKKYLNTRLHYRVDHVDSALSLISGNQGILSIKELQRQTNTTRKTLERAFLHYLGLHPKLYSQIVRYNTARQRMEDPRFGRNLTELAYELGYYDGSHFASEFKRFSGVTPRKYVRGLASEAGEDQAEVQAGLSREDVLAL